MQPAITDTASTLRVLWDARSIAVIGATDRPGAIGRPPVEFLLRHGYAGRIVAVNPKGGSVCGIPVSTELTEPVDLALILVPAGAVAAVVRTCGEVGVPVAVVMSSGFAEAGDDGGQLQHDLVATARKAGVRLVGPNCIGSVGFATGQTATFSPLFTADVPAVPGRIGFATQSGALGFGTVSLALERGLGLHSVVNTGNEADVSTLEVLEALGREPGVDALLGYVETLADGAALRRLAAGERPVALLKAGTSGAGSRAAASHTGALATADRIVDAALRQYGIARARDVDDLLDLGVAFTTPHRPRGGRIAVVTTSGGSGILAADAIEAAGRADPAGLSLAQLSTISTTALAEFVPDFGSTANPVDVTAAVMSDPDLLRRALDVVVDDPDVDAVVACFCVLTGEQVLDIVAAVGAVAGRTGKPVFVARTGADFLAPGAGAALRDARIPAYPTPARAVGALAGLLRTTRASAVAATTPPASAAPPAGVSEPALKRVLAAAGIPVPRGRLVDGPADAEAAVHEVGGQAVAKAVVAGLTHKSDVGGVRLGITAQQAPEAFAALTALGGTVLIEELAPVDDGAEVLVGVTSSPLGPVLTLATGGVLTEVIDDAVVRLLPTDRATAQAMIGELRGAPLLTGHRGSTPLDVTALADLLVAVSDLTAGWPDGLDLDLNPVLVLPTGVVVLDAALTRTREDPAWT